MSSTEMKPTSEASSAAEAVEQSQSILDRIAEQGRIGQSPEERSTGKLWLKDLVQDVMTGQMTVSKDTEAMINSRIADLDALISRQLNEVMHAEPLQKLEGSWRGLHYFVQQTETSSSLKIKLMNISKTDLFKDLDKAVEFDQSATFKKIYEEEYGTLGGAPFGALIGDYEFGRHPQDIALLEKMSGVAATSHAPFIAAATPAMFNFESFTELAGPRDLEKIFDNEAYLKWNMLRKSDDARYVGLCMPHVLMRLPYGKDTTPVEEFDYEENVDGRDHSKYLWGNAAYAFAARLTDAFARYEWCAAIRGVEGVIGHLERLARSQVARPRKAPDDAAIRIDLQQTVVRLVRDQHVAWEHVGIRPRAGLRVRGRLNRGLRHRLGRSVGGGGRVSHGW